MLRFRIWAYSVGSWLMRLMGSRIEIYSDGLAGAELVCISEAPNVAYRTF